MLVGCARDGGIDLEAMMADHNCERPGYQLGTPQYADCRMELARRGRRCRDAGLLSPPAKLVPCNFAMCSEI
jgi:hypothetical protein